MLRNIIIVHFRIQSKGGEEKNWIFSFPVVFQHLFVPRYADGQLILRFSPSIWACEPASDQEKNSGRTAEEENYVFPNYNI